MEASNLKEITEKHIKARLDTKKELLRSATYTDFFTVESVESLKWETLYGDSRIPVMADIISYDASAPMKRPNLIEKLSGDIPKTAISKRMNETDYLKYQNLKNRIANDNDRKRLYDYALNDTLFCYNGVIARLDWMGLQFISMGGFILDSTNNAGLVTAQFVGNGMPESNKFVSVTNWSNYANADGLADIRNVLLKAFEKGYMPGYIVMGRADFIHLMNQKATADKLRSWANGTTTFEATLPTLNRYLEVMSIPAQVIVIDTQVMSEVDGKRRRIPAWAPGRVAFIEDKIVGQMQHGPIAASLSESYKEKVTSYLKNNIFISKWGMHNPFSEWTMAETNAMPVLNNPNAHFTLKTDGTAYPTYEVGDVTAAMLLGEPVGKE